MEGYRIKAKSLADVQSALARMRESVQTKMCGLYAEWLGETCAEVCDMIALGRMERSERPIMDVAREVVAGRVQEAGALALPTPYNIRMLLRVFQKGKYCYLQGEPAGTALFDAVAVTEGVEAFGLSPMEMREGGNARRMAWESVFTAYRTGQKEPLLCDLTPKLHEGDNKVVFPAVSTRVEALARRSVMEDYLAVISRQMAIPPQDLMRRIDEALAYLLSPAGKLAMETKSEQLLRILIDLDAHPELIYGDSEAASAPEETADTEILDTKSSDMETPSVEAARDATAGPPNEATTDTNVLLADVCAAADASVACTDDDPRDDGTEGGTDSRPLVP